VKPLIFYTEKKYLPENTGWLEMLYPFWDALDAPIIWQGLNIYDNYTKIGKSFFQISENPLDADFALLPNDWKRYERSGKEKLAEEFVNKARGFDLKTVVFFHSDFEYTIPLSDIIVFRTSLSSKKRKSFEFAMPGWSGDLRNLFPTDNSNTSPDSDKPRVSFCGASRSNSFSLWRQIKEFVKKHFYKNRYRFNALNFRYNILLSLGKSNLIETDFILRDSYLGNLKKDDKDILKNLGKRRKEYFDNMVSSQYVLCLRGVGNFSYRFYEAISMGRIPVFINTDCVLPFENFLNYSEFIVWVEPKDLMRIDELILDHYTKLGQSGLADLQNKLRSIWEEYLSPEGFFKNLHLILDPLKTDKA
jgi:hypothetical protein